MGEVIYDYKNDVSVAAVYNFGISCKNIIRTSNPCQDDPWKEAWFAGWDSDGVRIQWHK